MSRLKKMKSAATTAIGLGHEILHDFDLHFCHKCGVSGVELHEIIGSEYRKSMGTAIGLLYANVFPLCKKCHLEIENYSLEKQQEMLRDGIIKFIETERLISVLEALHLQLSRCRSQRLYE